MKFDTLLKQLQEEHGDQHEYIIRSVGANFDRMKLINQPDGIPKEERKHFHSDKYDSIDLQYGRDQIHRSCIFYAGSRNPGLGLKLWKQVDEALKVIEALAPKGVVWRLWATQDYHEMRLGYEDTVTVHRDRLKSNVGDDDELGLTDLFDNL